MRTMRPATAFALALLSAAGAASAAPALSDNWAILGLPDPFYAILGAAVIAGLGIFYSVFIKAVSERGKTLAFVVISVPILLATAYFVAATAYLDYRSWSGGPVHWHADYEIWACGQEYVLAHSRGLDNKVGTPLVHTHDDERIHVEGVLLSPEQASLGNYFSEVGGQFNGTTLTLPTDNGTVTWQDGDACDGRAARWYVFVDGRLMPDASSYRISPYTLVPPGDQIKFVFTQLGPSLINGSIGGPP